MKTVLDIGALLVMLVIGFALWQKYSAQLIAAANPQNIVDVNRGNADTSLMSLAGTDAINDLNDWVPLAPFGGN